MYNKLIRAAKKVYFEESLEKNKSNLKKCWDVLREAIRKKNDKSGDIEELKINGNSIKDGLYIATSFNNYFTTIADSIAADINPTDRPPDELMEQSNCQFKMEYVTSDTIKEITRNMESKTSQDMYGL